MILYRAKCKTCSKIVLYWAETYDAHNAEMFEVAETRILVIQGTPVINGESRVIIGPVRTPGKPPNNGLFRPDFEKPVATFGHVRHGCEVKGQGVQNTATNISSPGLNMTNSTSGTLPAPPAVEPMRSPSPDWVVGGP